MITGRDLIAWGYTPGDWFGPALAAANAVRPEEARAVVARLAPPPFVPLREAPLPYALHIEAENEAEAANIASVRRHMDALMRVPTARAGAVMPDACPSSPALGHIPVGGVVATENAIHPGMHSADICCSMALTTLPGADPKAVLDAAMAITHFGGGGRAPDRRWAPPDAVLRAFEANPFLRGLASDAIEHFGTQGDGNHFFFVGRLASAGETAIVTHHGSRKPGAALYKAGMAAANRTRLRVSPETAEFNAWIVADSREGEDYWNALQAIRGWTKANHFAIHDAVAEAVHAPRATRFWNEHNFVFRKSDGLFYHAKGATPAFAGFADDDSGHTLIPLNMAEPILVARHRSGEAGLGFAPHGAGRNLSRTAHMRSHGDAPAAEIVARETRGLDARFFSGVPDVSELPSAYKNAASIRRQIARHGLADIVDAIEPYGCIMAGDWKQDAPWRKKKARPS